MPPQAAKYFYTIISLIYAKKATLRYCATWLFYFTNSIRSFSDYFYKFYLDYFHIRKNDFIFTEWEHPPQGYSKQSYQNRVMLALKEATSEKHRAAERMPFNIRMFKGQLSKEEYLLYLVQQKHLFESLERDPLPHPALHRVPAVEQDMAELTAAGARLGGVLPSTAAYASYLDGLDAQGRLPHVYLHYLALMFGGQMMKSKVPSSGKMYDFSEMQDALQAVRRVQQDAWADEVNMGFDYTIGIFQELEEQIVHTNRGASV